jgi:hypothetical protein
MSRLPQDQFPLELVYQPRKAAVEPSALRLAKKGAPLSGAVSRRANGFELRQALRPIEVFRFARQTHR